MSYQLQTEGIMVQQGFPAIGSGEGRNDIVNLDTWIAAVRSSPRLKEVIREDSRPTAIFTCASGEECEVIYLLGFIVPFQNQADHQLHMQELAQHLNQITETGQPVSHSERP